MRFRIWLFLLLGAPAYAATTVSVHMAMSAYAKPDFESQVLFTIEPGSKITVGERTYGGFRKVRAMIDGRARIGYVPVSDLMVQDRPAPEKPWGMGAGFVHSQYSQGSKKFVTSADQVEWTIDRYEGSGTTPSLVLQWGQRNFWRLYGGYRTVQLEGKATQNIVGSSTQTVSVEYKMVSVGVQGGWGLFSKFLYAGGGLDVSKSISGKVKFGTQDFSNQAEYPDYIGAHALAGAQLRIGSSLSAFFEARYGVFPNQDPMVTVLEVGAFFLYWP